MRLLETQIDDMPGEGLGYLMERLLAERALDVYYTPVYMKKNRPGVLVSVICRDETCDTMLRILFEETTTLGVRVQTIERVTLEREWETVEVFGGKVRLKVAMLPDGNVRKMPEYEDCKQIAAEKGIALQVVMREALQAEH